MIALKYFYSLDSAQYSSNRSDYYSQDTRSVQNVVFVLWIILPFLSIPYCNDLCNIHKRTFSSKLEANQDASRQNMHFFFVFAFPAPEVLDLLR